MASPGPARAPGDDLAPTPDRPAPWSATRALLFAAGRRPVFVLGALAALQAALPVAGLLAMKQLVDAVADGVAGRTAPGPAFDAALLATALAAAVAFAGGLLRSVAAVVSEDHGRRLGDAGVQRLQEHAARAPLEAFDRPAFHDALQRAGAEAGQRPVRLTQDLSAFAVAALSLVAMAALLSRVELWLPVLVGLAAAPIAWARRRHARLRYGWHRDHVVEQREVGYLGAAMTGRATAKDVRLLGLAERFGARLLARRSELRRSLAGLARRRARDELLAHTLASAALFGAYVYLAHDALGGGMTLGGLVLHAQAAQRTQNAVRDLLAAHAGLTEHRLFLRPLLQFYEQTPTPVAPPNAPPAAARPIAFAARALTFVYADAGRPALSRVDATIAPGERVAVVGPNGSGKSTFVKLLCGLYEPTAGALLVDDGPATPRAHRLAVLLQDAAAFELTLRENLALGADEREPPDDAALWRALELVGLAERVRALPDGLDTPWSRRLRGGVDWSVGEARRLVLARALLQPRDGLLLDEPFAFLDGETATRIADRLRAMPRDRTLVLVDHRGPALDVVDRVLWLDGGRVVRDGAPAELLADPAFAAQFPDRAARPGPRS